MSMTPERWQEVLRLHGMASELRESEREAFLARECDDREVLVEVRRMLGVHTPEGFLEPPTPADLSAGREIGDFTLLEEVGRGGMGIVYRALQRPLGRVVAVKLLPPSFGLTPRQIDRFEREARSAARLTHPSIVAVLTVGEEGGLRFFAMEYVEGNNFAEELKRLRADLGATDDERAHLPSSHSAEYFRFVADCARQVADGLAFAHRHHVIHRDVKPSNMLLDSAGHVKLVDFGLARDEELGTFSSSGDVVGTPHYMSPEQARAHRHQIDHRTDVYSLGVVLYELLTLKRPFEGRTSQEVIDHVLREDPVPVRKLNPRVPRDLATICHTAMAREPKNRYATADALRDDLTRFLSHESIHARPPGALRIVGARLQRHRVPLGLLATGVLAILAGVLWQGEHARQARRTENIEAIRAALAEGPLGSLTLAHRIELLRRMDELQEDGSVRAAESEDTLLALQRAFEELEREGQRAALADLATSRDPGVPAELRLERRLRATMSAWELAQLFPANATLADIAAPETMLPRLSVSALDADGRPTPAEVHAREIRVDTSVGERVPLGSTPLGPLPIRPGYWRIEVVFERGRVRELALPVELSDGELTLRAQLREDETAVQRGMVRFEPCDYVFPSHDFYDQLEGRTIHLEPYWMDETEVSNRQYAVFVRATGHRLPAFWEDLTDLDAFLDSEGDKPVVGVSVEDAQAFAAWAGKRLPTVAEWLRAAGGEEKRHVPYLSADPQEPARGNVLGPSVPAGAWEEGWQAYLEHASGVRSHPDARTPEGLFHMWGNVDELTESMPVTAADARAPVALRGQRVFLGGSWSAVREGMDTLVTSHMDADPRSRSWHIGFRCARSDNP